VLQAEACNTAEVRSIYDSHFFVVDSYRLYEVFPLSPLQESLGIQRVCPLVLKNSLSWNVPYDITELLINISQ